MRKDVVKKGVYIYGNGNCGRKIFHKLSQVDGITMSGYIVSDGQDKNQKAGEKVYYLSEINLNRKKGYCFCGNQHNQYIVVRSI